MVNITATVSRRVENWPVQLSLFLRARRAMPFAWGHHDCLIFAADAVAALTGFDPAASWRGYATQEEADALLAQLGGMEAAITSAIGVAPHRRILHARRGDIVLFQLGGRYIAGIVDDTGMHIAAPCDRRRLVRLPLRMAELAWSY